MESEQQREHMLERLITRRSAIKAGGIAAVGLAFSKPIIHTIHPGPTFNPGPAFAQSSPPPEGRGACAFDGPPCVDDVTRSECESLGGFYGGDGSACAIVP